MHLSISTDLARQQMIDQQVRAWEVLNPEVLAVLSQVRRENFVPANFKPIAFADCSVPLGHGQIMLAPKLDGRILQALQIQPGDQVLDVGAGSGFLAACFGRLAGHVRAVELFADLAERAATNLHAAATNNVVVEVADALQLQDENRYDAIAVTGSLPIYDERFQRALKVGGRLLVVVGQAPIMSMLKVTRIGEHNWQRESLLETVIPPLINAKQPSHFSF